MDWRPLTGLYPVCSVRAWEFESPLLRHDAGEFNELFKDSMGLPDLKEGRAFSLRKTSGINTSLLE